MLLDSCPVIHIVDEGTPFFAAAFLRNQTTRDMWKTIWRLWIEKYMGPPDILLVDKGFNYTSKQFKENVKAAEIDLVEAPM